MKLAIALTTYVAAIVAANVMTTHLGLVSIGFGLLVTAGTFAAGFALFARDYVQRFGGIPWSLGAIAIGGALSWFMADPFIALASVVAFTAAELVDLGVYTPTKRRWGFPSAVILSGLVAAPVDTVLFLHIAGFPLTLNAVLGQLVAKVVIATLLPLALAFAADKTLNTELVTA